MFKFKERRAAEAARRAAVAEQNAAAAAAQHRALLVQKLDEAKNFTGVDISQVPQCPLHAHAGERVFLDAIGAQLIEPRRGPGHYSGFSQGVSVHVPGTKSMRYRIGANRGTFVQGEEVPTPIDKGTFVITDQRAVFIGEKDTREWLWSKLLGFTHATDAPWTAIAVSNRQKTSGVLYDRATEDQVRFMLDLAAARSTGDTASLVEQIQAELTALGPGSPPAAATALTAAARASAAVTATEQTGSPSPAREPAPPLPPQGWFPDPTHRHEMRYWNGTSWTEHVADRGTEAIDALQ